MNSNNSEGKKIKKGKEKNNKNKVGLIIKRVILYVILIVCICALIYSGKILLDYYNTNKESNEAIKSINDAVKEKPSSNLESAGAKFEINFNELEKINPDVVAWITIDNTSLDYAVLQSYDNNYYLRRSIYGGYSWFGWPFMDYRNDPDFTDKNTIIYGHNIQSGLMFADLERLEAGNYGNYVEIKILTKDKLRVYQVFSSYIISPESYYLTTNFSSNSVYENFLNTIKGRSSIDFNVDVSAQDKILTLSTCTADAVNRIAVHAKLIREEDRKE